jgi:hypothetical protein
LNSQYSVLVKSVFQRLNFMSEPVIGEAGSSYIQNAFNSISRPTYDKAVSRQPKSSGLSFKAINARTVGRNSLPGLIPHLNLASFLDPDTINWPDSCQNWFKAQGPSLKPIYSSCLKEFAHFSEILWSFLLCVFASSANSKPQFIFTFGGRIGCNGKHPDRPQTICASGVSDSASGWKNGGSSGGRSSRPRQNEEVAITTITPMPLGQVEFVNVEMC